jgi:phage shock protein A
VSIIDKIRRITEETLNWPADKNGQAEPALGALVAESNHTFQEGREKAAAYGATIRRLEEELEQLSVEYRALEAQADKAPDPVSLRRNHADQARVQERMAQVRVEVEQGRATSQTLQETLQALEDQLQRARLKLQDLRARDLIEGDSKCQS